MKKSILFAICLSTLVSTNAYSQKINPDLNGITVKYTLEEIHSSENAVNFQHVKGAVDSNGNLYAVFHDPSEGRTYFAKGKSGSWKVDELITRDENDGYPPEFPAISIDNADGIHVVFTQFSDKLIYGKKNPGDTEWAFETVNGNDAAGMVKFSVFDDYLDMCIDDKGGVHIILSGDGRDQNDESFDCSAIYFYKPAGGTWTSEIVKRGIVNTYNVYGTDPSIVVQSNEVIVTFGGYNSINIASKSIGNSTWQIEQLFVNDDMNGGKEDTSLCLTPDGKAVLAYADLFGGNNYQGLNVVSESPCAKGWHVDTSLAEGMMRSPAIGVDGDGVYFLAYEHNPDGLTIAYRSCTSDRTWKTVFNDSQIFTSFIDMVIDGNNHAHVFYTTKTAVKHVELYFDGDPEKDANLQPFFTGIPATNVKPGEEVSVTLRAFDPECDEIQFYAIILPDGWSLKDNSNGTATLNGKMSDNEGEAGFSVFVSDKHHKQGTKPVSAMVLKFKATVDGKEKGEVKINYDEGPLTKDIIDHLTAAITPDNVE